MKWENISKTRFQKRNRYGRRDVRSEAKRLEGQENTWL